MSVLFESSILVFLMLPVKLITDNTRFRASGGLDMATLYHFEQKIFFKIFAG